MAEKALSQEISTGLQDLKREITCAICHRHYTDPKVLPCCHYYCKQCIDSLASRQGFKNSFPCPECRAETTLPRGGARYLQSAFFVNRMKDIHSKLELVHGKVEAKCEMCSVDKAEAFCRQCAQFICAECVKSHQRMRKAFLGHVIVSSEELKKGKPSDFIVTEAATKVCEQHDQPMNVYCFDCKALICLYCSIKAHNGHNHEAVKCATGDTKKRLLEKVSSLTTARGTLSQAIKIVRAAESSITIQGKNEAEKIESSFAYLVKVIEQRKNELLAESKKNVTRKLNKLSSQEKSLLIKHATLQSVLDYTGHFIKHSSDSELMSKHAEMHDRIEKELKLEGLDPVEEADTDVEVNCVEQLHSLLQTNAKIQAELTVKCSVARDQAALIAEKKICQVSIKFSNGQPKVKKADIKYGYAGRDRCLSNEHIDQVEAGQYTIPIAYQRMSIYVKGRIIEGGAIEASPAKQRSPAKQHSKMKFTDPFRYYQ